MKKFRIIPNDLTDTFKYDAAEDEPEIDYNALEVIQNKDPEIALDSYRSKSQPPSTRTVRTRVP